MRIETLSSPETLPEPFIEAILAIEELAAPENRPRLDAAVREARVRNPWLDLADTPECLALQLWLLSPYQRQAPPMVGRVSPSAPSQTHDHPEGARENTQSSSTASTPPPAPLAHPMGEGSRVRAAV